MKMLTTKGTVTNIEDPAKAGRIKVHLAELGGRETPDFIDPVLLPGWHWLPEVGDVVEVIMPCSDDDLVEYPEEIRWCGVVYDQENPVPEELRAEYPRRRGFKTKAGHLFIVDDTTDKEEISLVHKGSLFMSITNDGIFFGTKDADEPFVLGNKFQSLLSTILGELGTLQDNLLAHTHTGVTTGPGVSGTPDPASLTAFGLRKTAFANAKATVDNGDQLSDFIKGQKTKPS